MEIRYHSISIAVIGLILFAIMLITALLLRRKNKDAASGGIRDGQHGETQADGHV